MDKQAVKNMEKEAKNEAEEEVCEHLQDIVNEVMDGDSEFEWDHDATWQHNLKEVITKLKNGRKKQRRAQ